MSSDSRADLVIVGGGAAGLATAIFAAEALEGAERRVVVLDGAKRLGAKILVSGGGRCNVTHREVSATDFNGRQVLVRNVIAALPVERTIAWFASLGVELVEEDSGKLFPVGNSARTVLEALTTRCMRLGVELRSDHRVSRIHSVQHATGESGFTVTTGSKSLEAGRVVLATGGRSLPRTGSDGGGWRIAEELGHSVTRTVPALVPLKLEDTFFHEALSGISCMVELTTRVGGRIVDRRSGSLLWTHFGVSGPVVMDASRFYTSAVDAGESVMMSCSFAPGRDAAEVERSLLQQAAAAPKAAVKTFLAKTLPERLAETLCRRAGVDARTPAGQLSKPDRRRLIGVLTQLPLPITGDRGWNHAEVTAGGIPLDEVNYRTMESRRAAGLYLVGEALDCDGRIGGFNFQWAWSTGYVAGRAAAAGLTTR